MTQSLKLLVANRRAELDLSLRAAADKTIDRTGRPLISHATISEIERGAHTTNYADRTLQGLALALDLPLSKIREAAGVPVERPTEFRLPKKANQLTPAEQKAILQMVDALLSLHEEPKGR